MQSDNGNGNEIISDAPTGVDLIAFRVTIPKSQEGLEVSVLPLSLLFYEGVGLSRCLSFCLLGIFLLRLPNSLLDRRDRNISPRFTIIFLVLSYCLDQDGIP